MNRDLDGSTEAFLQHLPHLINDTDGKQKLLDKVFLLVPDGHLLPCNHKFLAVPTSSPIQPPKDINLAIILQQYIHWQKYKCLTWAHQLSRVYNILSLNCYDLITIQT
jgi:hypothetical protein